MKTTLVLTMLAVATYVYFHNPASTTPTGATVDARSSKAVTAPAVVIAAAPSSYERWKTGPNAQTDLKTGPNAQTEFLPFAPSEHATWNQTPVYTIVSGRQLSGRIMR
jgi:hypothetical protein